MKILKAINNNIVSAMDAGGQEIVVMGRGIGFRAREGMELPEEKVEKIFRMETQSETDRLKTLLSSMPLEHIQITDAIIAYADQVLKKELNQTIYITLTDHISFAIYRHTQGMMFENPLLREVRRFYHLEYAIGEYALTLIKKQLDISFPADEAASIALHIVNAEYDTSVSDAVHITQLLEDALKVVKKHFQVDLDEESLDYDRFVTHLNFFALRIFKGEPLKNKDPELYTMLSNLYPEEAVCAKEIQALIEEKFTCVIAEEEVSYLTLHIRRMVNQNES